MNQFVSLAKIQEGSGESYKVRLEGEVLQQFKAYEKAYNESYGGKVSSELLIGFLVEYGLSKDTKFKKWYKQNREEIENI